MENNEEINSLKINKEELLEDVYVVYDKRRKISKYRSSAKLRIDGYIITIESKYYETIDDAVYGIKWRIIEAIEKFDKLEKEKK